MEKAADILNIEHLLQRKPKELSGGQRQRVAIGRAIVREPTVFLFDEPLSNLDAKLRGHMRAELAMLHERLGKTTVYVTHDQVEAMTLASRIVIFDKGHIQQVGTPGEVFNQPANLFVAGFIGMPSMNLLGARCEPRRRHGRLRGEGFALPAPPGSARVRAADQALTVGVRPQALRPAPARRRCRCRSTWSSTWAPSRWWAASMRRGGQRITAMLPGDAHSELHQKIGLRSSPDDLHVFDRASGQRCGPDPRRRQPTPLSSTPTTLRRRHMKRRDFIKGAAITVLGAGLALQRRHAQDRYAKYKGQTVVMNIPAHPHYDAMLKILPEFTKETGIKVEIDKLAMAG